MIGLRRTRTAESASQDAARPPIAAQTASQVAAPTENIVSVPHLGRNYKLFFLLGHPKSGTNWVGAVLNLHPRINVQGEFRFEALRNAFDTLQRHWWHVAHDEPARSVAEECLRDSVRRIMAAVADKKPDALWIGDRTPRGLRMLLPGAPHIYIQRDPRDVLVSLAHQQIREAGANFSVEAFKPVLMPLHQAFTADPHYFHKNPHLLLSCEPWARALVRRYRAHISLDQEAIRQSRAGEFPSSVLVVRYEQLHAEFERVRGEMYAFLGLDPREAEPPARESRTLPGFEKEDPTSFFRCGAVADWKNYFTDDVRRWFKEEAGDLLMQLEYEKNDQW